MRDVSVSHRETWIISVPREEGDEWPNRPKPYAQVGSLYRPERMTITLTRGAKRPRITLRGHVLNSSGQPGARVATEDFDYMSPPPRWVADLARTVRRERGLTDARTEVPE